MFASSGLFAAIACPYQHNCLLPRCIFAHSDVATGRVQTQMANVHSMSIDDDEDRQRKRRKLHNPSPSGDPDSKIHSPASTILDQNALPTPLPKLKSIEHEPPTRSLAATRSISPPLTKSQQQRSRREPAGSPAALKGVSERTENVKKPPRTPIRPEALNPRVKIPAPASHDMRFKLLKALHEQLKQLNMEVSVDANDTEEQVVLSDQALVNLALDIEEEAAELPSIYSNLVKNKILSYKRMSVKQWIDERSREVAKLQALDAATSPHKPFSKPRIVETGLTTKQELKLLKELYTPTSGLSKHGYVSHVPSGQEIKTAIDGVEAAKGWEICDRCKSRFQVFPGRREQDGALASGGKCTYHFGKPYLPDRSAMDPKVKREKKYRCCGESLAESPGCTQAEYHVFKISEVKRLAAILNFEKTPDNPGIEPSRPVCIDGEMGYTVHGLELIRLTATSWPDKQELFDVLVRPTGLVLDLNSRFSGVWPKDFAEAPPWHPDLPSSSSKLHIVGSPAVARSLLFSHLSPDTPLIGHGLENDLNAARVIHPTIIDTALLFPHKAGLPYRNSLKSLMETHLNRQIQVVVDGNMNGHDSKEDANAAGELVRLALAEKWRKMKREGWILQDGDFREQGKGMPSA